MAGNALCCPSWLMTGNLACVRVALSRVEFALANLVGLVAPHKRPEGRPAPTSIGPECRAA
jgi:hypothetical protein